jgi:flagellar FliL protein
MAGNAKSGDGGSSGGLIGVLVVTLLAVAAGGGFGFFLSGNLKAPVEAKPVEKAKIEEKPSVPKGAKLVELKPMIANLADPKDAWMRIEATLVLQGEVEGAEALGVKIAEDIVAYLRTTTLAQFEGASGFQNLIEDLDERVRLRGGKDVRELAVHGVVIE